MLLFVYGTLKKGGRLSGYLDKSTYLGPAVTTFAEFNLIGGKGFPFLTKGHFRVRGDVYDVDRDTLKLLDRVEGVPHLYERTKANVNVFSTKINGEWAWVYISANEHEENMINVKLNMQAMEKEWVDAD